MKTETFRHRATVAAVQLTDEADWEEIAKWCGGELRNHTWAPGSDPETWLHLPDGNQGTVDDWVIRHDTEDGPDFGIVAFDEFEDLFEAVVRVDSLPTREQIYEAIAEAITEHVWAHGTGEISGDGIDEAADAVVALFGQTEGETP
jgi:hypothetical protein